MNDFASTLKKLLKKKPKVIQVGKIRDDEAAEAILQATIAGQIVLHTISMNNRPIITGLDII